MALSASMSLVCREIWEVWGWVDREESIASTMTEAAVTPSFEDTGVVQSPPVGMDALRGSVLTSLAMSPHPPLLPFSLQEWEKKQT